MTEEAGRMKNPAFTLYHLLWQTLDWLYPPVCGGCHQPGARWCDKCQREVHLIGGNCCAICGQPGYAGAICPSCQENPPAFAGLRSLGIFQGGLREAIHALKYRKDIGMGEAFAPFLIDLLEQQSWQIDAVTAVPLSSNRIRERGYNQSGFLARPLALHLRVPYRAQMIRRVRETRTQVGLNAVERRENVAGAFHSHSDFVCGKTLLIIDDVTTTGSTIQACAQALLLAGARTVYGMTLARAAHPQADGPSDPLPQGEPVA